MATGKLRRTARGALLEIPSEILAELGLAEGADVTIRAERGRIVVETASRRRPTRDELLAQCDPDAPPPPVDEAWLSSRPVGREII